ncbi:MAG TPA: hypothetical protein VFU72_13575 [Nitrolancea sp.]|nr:hypothetical protein [Nitrolancea sp.]
MSTTPHPSTRSAINTMMRAFVAELAAAGVPDPLNQQITLAALWDDLCRLSHERSPAAVECRLAGATAASTARASTTGPVSAAFNRLLGELTARHLPDPLAQRFTVGLVWAVLCQLGGEDPPALVQALLHAPVLC